MCDRALLFSALLLGSASALERVRIDPTSGHFITPDGRTKVFHGVNIVEKRFPWYPAIDKFDPMSSLVEQDMDDLASWGFNVVRLGVMWPGVEPAQGKYNTTYLGIMHKIVDDLYAKGIYTIIDFHQDAFSELWCGEGVPTWLIGLMAKDISHSCSGIAGEIAKLIGQCFPFKSFNISTDDSGVPEEAGCLARTFDWYSRTPEVNSAWDIFYKSPSIQALYQKMWKVVASEFSNSAGVIGYDLINEPLNADFYHDVEKIKPGLVDRDALQPMYTDVFKVIQREDPNAIAFYEPTPFPDTYPSNQKFPFGSGVKSTGFTTGAGADAAHQCLSWHVYSCGFAVPVCTREGDMPGNGTNAVADKWVADAVRIRSADAKRVGGAQFLTEFGACSGSHQCILELERVTAAADSAAVSWAYWQFKYFHDITTVSGPVEGFYDLEGNLQTHKVSTLSRTYAPSIAGTPLVTKYNSLTGAYHLRYSTDVATANLLTEIYLNEDLTYKNGYEVSTTNAEVASKVHNRIFVKAHSPNTTVDVSIIKKKALPFIEELGRSSTDDHVRIMV